MSQRSYIADLLVAPPSTEMDYTRLGNSGLKISKIILGAMSYGSKEWAKCKLNSAYEEPTKNFTDSTLIIGVLEEDEALPLLEHAYKVGINTWDTVRPRRVAKKAGTAYFT